MKVVYSLFVGVLVPVYWAEYGPKNFLWASDIALLLMLPALWLESRLLTGMMAVSVLVPDTLWIVDFAGRLAFGSKALPLLGTQYMFDVEIPLFVRGLSLFHVLMPILLVWLVHRLGYDKRTWLFQTLLAWGVVPLTYLVSTPSENINWVYGFGSEPQQWMSEPQYLGLLMLIVPVSVYLPTHLLLRRLSRR